MIIQIDYDSRLYRLTLADQENKSPPTIKRMSLHSIDIDFTIINESNTCFMFVMSYFIQARFDLLTVFHVYTFAREKKNNTQVNNETRSHA